MRKFTWILGGAFLTWAGVLLTSSLLSSCGSTAAGLGVGAACTSNSQCAATAPTCLTFKGGYCGIKGCTANSGCPQGSACVAHTDGSNYCFLQCTEKPQCNTNRIIDNEANCSSSVTYAEPATTGKACVPPSGT